MQRSESHRPKSILVLHSGALGDCVLAMHVVRRIRTRENSSKITLASRSGIARWAAQHGLIDAAMPLDRFGSLLWSDDDSRAKKRPIDISEFPVIVSFLGGPDEKPSRRLASLAMHELVFAVDPKPTEFTLQSQIHITHQWMEELRQQALDVDYDATISAIIGEADREELAVQLRHRIGSDVRGVVIVHPGSGGRVKCCPIEAMEALVRGIARRGRRPVWMIGPDEVERDGEQFQRRLETTAQVLYEESIEAAADLVAGADGYIGNDAGMTHVAALAGVETAALFGPTDPRIWRPLGARCQVRSFPSPDSRMEQWVESIIGPMSGYL